MKKITIIAVSIVSVFSITNVYGFQNKGNMNAVQWDIASGGNGHWYETIYPSNDICWTDARAEAELMGGYLATITTEEEQIFVAATSDSTVWSWLGGWKNGSSWEWVTGETWKYTNWHPNEPSGDGPSLVKDYGANHPLWNDQADCNVVPAYIVEWDFPDCNGNMVNDNDDIANGTSLDCNGNGVPDECDIAAGSSPDINPTDGIPDECQGLPVGACCFGTQCVVTTANNCFMSDGSYLGDDSWCEELTCGETGSGACCVLGSCLPATMTSCFASGGSFAGESESCDEVVCPTSCAADLNGDGIVKIQDLLLLIAAWGTCP